MDRKKLAAARAAGKDIRHQLRTIAMTEADLYEKIRQLCNLFGLRIYHTHDSRHSESGWPDLAIVGTRLLLRELKTVREHPTQSQREWLTALRHAGVDADVWRPDDWPAHIVRQLRAIQPKR